MNTRDLLARLMVLAFHLNLATAAAMVLWTAWTGYLMATGQLRPASPHAAPAANAVRVSVPACNCQRARRDELQVRSPIHGEAA
ncbi:MAG: hypothetical protein EKK52_14925 [Burkholderiales bacterium]|uniref:hypothetical protein n=1 Tax=Roseateles sp. TaxID=1971397 RepID=UPI000FAEDB81|nr:MAG: hypothetical protein EKK52_14925 [Burkholderiales bacterium]